jgi:hypothetical protein
MIYDDEAEQAGAGDHHGATGDPAAFVSRADPPPPVDDPRPPYDGQPRDHEQPPDGRLASDGGQPRGARPPVDGWFADAEAASDEGTAPDDRLAADDEPAADESADAGPEDDGLAADDDVPATRGELEKAEDLGLGEAERALLEWAMRRQTAAGEPLLPVAEAPPETRPKPERNADAPPRPAPYVAPTPRPEAPREPADEEPPSPWDSIHGSAEEAISALVAAGGPDPRDFASPRLTRRAKLVIALALVVLFVVSALGGFVGYRLTHRAAANLSAAAGRPAEVRGT